MSNRFLPRRAGRDRKGMSDIERSVGRLRDDIPNTTINYAPARAGDWDGTPPTTQAEAHDRLAYHISSGAGAVPIVELP